MLCMCVCVRHISCRLSIYKCRGASDDTEDHAVSSVCLCVCMPTCGRRHRADSHACEWDVFIFCLSRLSARDAKCNGESEEVTVMRVIRL